jgi:hypothetical protein
MNNPDSDNTGYTIHRTKDRENLTEGAINNEQSSHRQHWVHNTQNKD